jgi:hypothetical protein
MTPFLRSCDHSNTFLQPSSSTPVKLCCHIRIVIFTGVLLCLQRSSHSTPAPDAAAAKLLTATSEVLGIAFASAVSLSAMPESLPHSVVLSLYSRIASPSPLLERLSRALTPEAVLPSVPVGQALLDVPLEELLLFCSSTAGDSAAPLLPSPALAALASSMTSGQPSSALALFLPSSFDEVQVCVMISFACTGMRYAQR